ncbi:FERM and PDZ domain-containing protein 4 isoform X2 [Daktulosphaira vitifoliae]|uniref:FERM and PDZ domain-containing protein 4 isoform X2 n=1 Tax=Daktulosphaira vitifoliae TaxID=58002 RepID=UPI0021AA420B|nr:FERM and PDZ domain-containing protein 4 isoform X2 [Daktulosphaira vitifoliae]
MFSAIAYIAVNNHQRSSVQRPNRNGEIQRSISHVTQTASWLPPVEAWPKDPTAKSLPYGWEEALDGDGRPYFINHLTKTTSYEDPRTDLIEENPKPRLVNLRRHPELGFGFVAGSEKPVIVRFVTEGGPSDSKLLPGDQILRINDEDVQNGLRDYVIQLVRSCNETITLLVCQPPLDNSARKSALLSSAKKAKLKSNPSRVRFAEGVLVNGSPSCPVSAFSGGDPNIALLPNVLKVFLENGQTKSFKYDSTTKVKDVVASLQNKLCIKAGEHFALVLEQVKSLRRHKLTLLDPEHTLAKVASRPGSHNLRCLFRVAFVPRDACDLAQKDLNAFEYLYLQCCNDVVQERYAPELKYDIALRLAALHIHQHAMANNIPYCKVTVKAIEREFGLEKFVPISLMESMKRKELRKLLTHLLKLNQTMTGTNYKTLTALQAKLYYLTIISELPSYGAKCFSTNVRDCNLETVILISPKMGISQIVGLRNSMPVPLADIEQVTMIKVQKEDQISSKVTLFLQNTIQKEVSFCMEDRDADEFILVIKGYFKLLMALSLPIDRENDSSIIDSAPQYYSHHIVKPSIWSYEPSTINANEQEKLTNFAFSPMYTPFNRDMLKPNDYGSLNKTIWAGMQNGNVDKNMNTMSLKRPPNGHISFNLNGDAKNKSGIDVQSVVSMEILEGNDQSAELHNEEVLKRVAEMQQLVENSEQYLNRHQRESSDSDGSHISSDGSISLPPPPPHLGQLKHSDSLLLLAQKGSEDSITAAVQALNLGDMESDTESINTPSTSPSHRGRNSNRDSDISFGLHSPEGLVASSGHEALQELWKNLQEDNRSLPRNSLYLEPDLIDLTLLPPPTDKLKVNNDQTNGSTASAGNPCSLPPTFFADYDHNNQQNASDRFLDSVLDQGFKNNSNLMNLDLESFLATMTIPPPPQTNGKQEEKQGNVLTSEQISSFIIPPPPKPALQTSSIKSFESTNLPPLSTNLPPVLTNLPTNIPSVSQSQKYQPVMVTGNHSVKPQPLPTTVQFEDTRNIHVTSASSVTTPDGPNATNEKNLPGFSCCSKTKPRSPDNQQLPFLPTRAQNMTLPRVKPKVPPRIDSTLSTKPPLPPAPSQETLSRNGSISSSYTTQRDAVSVINELIDRLNEFSEQCNAAQAQGGGTQLDESKFQEAKDILCQEARQLVTSSKILIRCYMNPKSPEFQTNLSQCVTQLRRMTVLSGNMTKHTSSPLQTRNLILKVTDVLHTFHGLLVDTDVCTETLTKHAEGLANVLAKLLRSLRVFSP